MGAELDRLRRLRKERAETFEQAVERVRLEAVELLTEGLGIAAWTETGRRAVLVGVAHHAGASLVIEVPIDPQESSLDLGFRLAAAMGLSMPPPNIEQLRKAKARALKTRKR